jgi:hypothetical protein
MELLQEMLQAEACLLCGITFEVSGRQRQDAKPVQCSINHRTARAWWPADGAPLDRGVRPHSAQLPSV